MLWHPHGKPRSPGLHRHALRLAVAISESPQTCSTVVSRRSAFDNPQVNLKMAVRTTGSVSATSLATSLRLDVASALDGDDSALSRVTEACGEAWCAQIVLVKLWRVIDVPVSGATDHTWRAALRALRALDAIVRTWPAVRPKISARIALLRRLAATAPLTIVPDRPGSAQSSSLAVRAAVRDWAERVLTVLLHSPKAPSEAGSQPSNVPCQTACLSNRAHPCEPPVCAEATVPPASVEPQPGDGIPADVSVWTAAERQEAAPERAGFPTDLSISAPSAASQEEQNGLPAEPFPALQSAVDEAIAALHEQDGAQTPIAFVAQYLAARAEFPRDVARSSDPFRAPSPKASRPKNDAATRNVSKLMSKLLRHEATNLGVPMTKDGWVTIGNVLRAANSKDLRDKVGNTAELGDQLFVEPDLLRVVREDDKQRFVIRELADGTRQLRAAQGHADTLKGVVVQQVELTPQTAPRRAVHGTYWHCWDQISKKGLTRMSRHQIHLAVSDALRRARLLPP